MSQLTFGSLFAGIGGFDLGFERAGMVCKWQVEIDDYVTKVLKKHWPNVHRERDIRQCGKHNLEPVDVVCGGFPCQDISYAGLGAGLDGERSGLFFEAVRLVRELQPRIVVLENVAALLTRGLDRVLGTLAEIGFDAEWHCIPAASVGAPHIRDRVFVLAYAAGERFRETGQRGKRQAKRIGFSSKVLAYSKSHGRFQRLQNHRWGKKGDRARQEHRPGCCSEDVADTEGERFKRDGTTKQQVSIARCSKKELERFCCAGGSDHWATEPELGRVANGISNRAHRLRGLGNAVVPQVAEFIGRQIVERKAAGL
jgi:DNA (cytosine-5)-methyltransferase 1